MDMSNQLKLKGENFSHFNGDDELKGKNFFDEKFDDEMKIPNHVAVIADGNRRWAKNLGLDTLYGHTAGYETIKNIIQQSIEVGVKYLTFFCFSTENQKRSDREKKYLFNLFEKYIRINMSRIVENDVKIVFIGDLSYFSSRLQMLARKIEKLSSNCSKITVCVALNYGARNEIIAATKKIAEKIYNNEIQISDVTEKMFSENLYTKNIPDPDVLIRTGGEERVSNFLLWQISYAELIFVKKFFPEFSKEDFMEALKTFSLRKRRFGV